MRAIQGDRVERTAEPSDGVVVRAVLTGDVEQYAVLVRRYRDRYARYASRMLGSADAAEDAVQDALIRAYEQLGQCRDPDNFAGWFFLILRNRCFAERRRHRRVDGLELADGLAAPELRALFAQIRKDGGFTDAFFLSPAAVTMHHARIGGLAEHSLGALRIAQAVADIHPWLDRDVLTAGCLLHDVGKVKEYAIGHAFEVTLEGRLVGHIAAGVSMVEGWSSKVRGFSERLLMELTHIVISHHGQLEHGSPKTPATPEALVVHFADDLDAKLDMLATAGAAVAGDDRNREAYVKGLRRSFLFFRDVAVFGPEPTVTGERGSAHRDTGRGSSDDDQGKLF